ncbi:MAG: DUF924 family protein [Pseudomonadota bacterium]
MVSPTDVTKYWIDEVGETGWYKQDAAIDGAIRSRFFATWEAASHDLSILDSWCATPDGTLAALILLDQFPRNMFRDDPRAFSTDDKARAVSKKAIERGCDVRIPEPERQFFYLPLMHSECLCDQERCVRLLKTRMTTESANDNLLHAKAHREVIRRFGRFPTRNAALSRQNTCSEATFVEEEGGYGALVNALRAA